MTEIEEFLDTEFDWLGTLIANHIEGFDRFGLRVDDFQELIKRKIAGLEKDILEKLNG